MTHKQECIYIYVTVPETDPFLFWVYVHVVVVVVLPPPTPYLFICQISIIPLQFNPQVQRSFEEIVFNW